MYIYCQDNPVRYTDPSGEVGVPGSGATYTEYKATFYVRTKSNNVKLYKKHTNKDSDLALTVATSGTTYRILGGYSDMFALEECVNDKLQIVFVNKSDVKPYQELDNGVYFIKNLGTNKYMDVKGGKTDNDTPVQQWGFNGTKAQQWIITYGSDGFYRLSPENAPSKALDITSASWAKANNKNTKIYEYQSSGVTQQKWIIGDSSAGNGSYRLITKESVFGANDQKCLEIGSNNTDSGKPVQTWDSEKNDAKTKKQQWKFEPRKFAATVNNFRDDGYNIYYGQTTADSEAYINARTDVVKARYDTLLDLQLTRNNTTYFRSRIDTTCKGTVTSSNISTLCTKHLIACTCNPSCTNAQRRCTHLNTVVKDFSTAGNNTTTRALWSAHRIATNTSDNRSYSYSGTHRIFLLARSTSNRERDSQGILMHELNHQYGGKDHYHDVVDGVCKNKAICSDVKCGTNPRPADCIMAKSRQNISSSTILCNSCKNEIISHLADHHAIRG